MGPVKAEAERAAHPQAENRAVSRAAHRDATEDRMSGVRSRKAAQADQRPINTEANITEQPCRSRSRHHTSDNPRITPELSRPAKRVRLERTVMRAKVNPKPTACNGPAMPSNTEKRSVSTGQVEASKDRSRQRRQSVSHEALHVPSGANAMHPKPSEAKCGNASGPDESANDRRRSPRCNRSQCVTEADNTNTPTHA